LTEEQRRILVVDDETTIRKLLQRTLEAAHYDVVTAASGEEALKKVSELDFRVVLLDITMPGMSGMEVLQQLTANWPETPVVMVTALADAQTAVGAMKMGAYDYVIKPFDSPDLLQKIHSAIEKRKKIAKEIFDNAANLWRVITKNADSMIIINKSGVVLFANPATESLFERKADELVGKKFSFPVMADEITEINIQRKGEQTAVAEMRVVETEWNGEHVYLASLRDITERKRAQESKIKELESLSYSIAHDLRSPLISIQGHLGYLIKDIQNQEIKRVQEDARLIESGVRKMDQLVKGTLEYFRSGYLVKPDENVPFREIVEEVLKLLDVQLRSIGATVSLAETFPTVYVDRMRMVQVLSNLIQNSINYRDKTRPMTIEIGHSLLEDKDIYFVRDNGIGIDASESEKVFTLFYRGTTDSEGSGAGLAIVKRIIEIHGGRIWVQVQQEKGTTMCFTLPQQNGAKKGDNNGKG
jgi:signal transduction histidine kinase